jgi:hypothetical protein
MEQHPKQALLERSVAHDKTRRLMFGVGSGVGAILCLTWTATQEEMLAYIGLGKYFILWGVTLAYHVWAVDKQAEIEKRFSAR